VTNVTARTPPITRDFMRIEHLQKKWTPL